MICNGLKRLWWILSNLNFIDNWLDLERSDNNLIILGGAILNPHMMVYLMVDTFGYKGNTKEQDLHSF